MNVTFNETKQSVIFNGIQDGLLCDGASTLKRFEGRETGLCEAFDVCVVVFLPVPFTLPHFQDSPHEDIL